MDRQIAAYTGPDAKDKMIQWAKDNGYVSGQVRIRQKGETVWVELVDVTAA